MIRELDLSNASLIASILTIQRRAYKIEADIIGFNGIPQLNETEKAIRVSKERFFGFYLKNQLAGVVSIEEHAHEMEICRLIVNPDQFRKGIGRSLLTYVLQENSSKRLLVCTGSKNVPAITLYKSLGFTKIGEKEVEPGILISEFEKK